MWVMHAKLLKGTEKIFDVRLGVVFCVDVKVSNFMPVTISAGLFVMRCVVDEVLSESRVVVNGKFAFGEMTLANKPIYEHLVQVCPFVYR